VRNANAFAGDSARLTNVITFSIPPACNCDPIGSKSTQCNRDTGQCDCLEGVDGVRCNRCKRGFTGQVPNCQPCGECFDNWDTIILNLKSESPSRDPVVVFLLRRPIIEKAQENSSEV